ncbi:MULTISPECIES: hypothetical protein [unclassified Streptomyces]|uniref:hypothetical protein n=1 Tax=unclassified Streptomyces TaxID=2593676 RepID=UPI000DC3DA5E|nr:hypothetical protein [Streptomyces sp. PsTaAH-137]MYT68236.1 hypothetical protein [Streptomyces sp. SID8367]RAJ76868.1 hypothetical protein K377_06036 [Streptomyces sp. PsTaAH-137]
MTPAPTPPVLLAVDHPAQRAEAPLSALPLPALHPLLPEPPPPEPPGPYLDGLRAALPSGAPGAVLASCASAPLAAVVAARAGRAVPLVLFDAEPVTAATVLTAYRDTVAQLGVLPDHREARHLAGCVAEPGVFLAVARQRLAAHVGGALGVDGAATEEVEDLAAPLVDAALRWLAHLLAAHHAPPPASVGPTLRILSANTPGDGLRVGCDRADLLRDPRTADAVVSFLAAHGVRTDTDH